MSGYFLGIMINNKIQVSIDPPNIETWKLKKKKKENNKRKAKEKKGKK